MNTYNGRQRRNKLFHKLGAVFPWTPNVVLRFCPKWKGEPTIPIARRHGYEKASKQSKNLTSSTHHSDTRTFHIVDEDDEVQELHRPPGRDSRNKVGKSVGSSSTRVDKILEQLSFVYRRFKTTNAQVVDKLSEDVVEDRRLKELVRINTMGEHVHVLRVGGKTRVAHKLEQKYLVALQNYHEVDDE